MASTITLTGDWLVNIGNRMQTSGTGNLGTYATGGIAVTAAQVGLGTINSFVVDPAGGYSFAYSASTGKVLAYFGNGGLVAHTHDLLLKNAAVVNATTTAVNAGTNLLGANTGSDITVTGSGANGGIVAVSAGSAGAGTEVTTSTNLAGITFNWRAIGI